MCKLHKKEIHDDDMGAAKDPERHIAPMCERKVVVKLLYDMSAFNILTQQIVHILGDGTGINTFEICREEGITYKVPG